MSPMFSGNSKKKIAVLLTCCFALFMAMLDNTVVNVALPTISDKLGAGVSGLQWIVDGYVLAFCSLLLTGGIAGDRYGRKRTFILGLSVFTLASLACGLSGSTGELIVFRALQGVGAALLMPGSLSIITVTFPPTERAKAIGTWAGVSGLALAFGPTAGGFLIERIGWQSIFFLNVPIGILAVIVAARVVSESRAEQARQLDFTGLALGTAGLFAVTYALIEANQRGWSDQIIVGALALGALLLVAFCCYEFVTRHPMMPLDFFRFPAFSAGVAVAFCISLGMFGTFFFFSLYMQLVRGYSALQTGVRILPITGMIFFVAPQAGRWAQKHGSRGAMTAGPILAGTGLLALSRVGVSTNFTLMIPVLMMMGIGMGLTMTPMTAAVMNAVGAARAGLGSAMTNTSREAGGVFGIALLGTLLTTKLKSVIVGSLGVLGIPLSQRLAIAASAGHGTLEPSLLRGLTPQQATAVRAAFDQAFIKGLHIAFFIAALFVLASAIIANRFIPSGAPQSDEESSYERFRPPAGRASSNGRVERKARTRV